MKRNRYSPIDSPCNPGDPKLNSHPNILCAFTPLRAIKADEHNVRQAKPGKGDQTLMDPLIMMGSASPRGSMVLFSVRR